MESSRRDLSNDMAEQRPILKNNQNTGTYHLRFGFTPLQVEHSPKRGFIFTVLVILSPIAYHADPSPLPTSVT